MALRLFVYIDGNEIASFGADHVPRVGETVWLKTVDHEATVIIDGVEHQFDRSRQDTYSNQDVCLHCRKLTFHRDDLDERPMNNEAVAKQLLELAAWYSMQTPVGWASHYCGVLQEAARLLRGDPASKPDDGRAIGVLSGKI